MNNFIHFPIFSKMTKSVPAGVVLSYIVGLTRQINPIKITNEELATDLYFTIPTIIRAKKKLKEFPFIDISVVRRTDQQKQVIGIITQYEIDLKKLNKYIKGFENE